MNRVTLLVIVVFLALSGSQVQAADHRIGGGLNYWVALDDVDVGDVDDDGFSYLISYQYWPGLLGQDFQVHLQPEQTGPDGAGTAGLCFDRPQCLRRGGYRYAVS